jgi:acylglycerol lipase
MHDGQVSLLLAATALDAAGAVWATLPTWRTSTLVLHGTADTYTDLAASRDFVAGAGGPDTRLETVEGGYHELLNDVDAETVVEVLLGWLDERTREPS